MYDTSKKSTITNDMIKLDSLSSCFIENRKYIYLLGASLDNLPKQFKFTSLINKEDIKNDELTNEPLKVRSAEFSHIRSVAMYKFISDSIDNGLIVNKETHKIITAEGVNDENELLNLCQNRNWSVDWYDIFLEKLSHLTG